MPATQAHHHSSLLTTPGCVSDKKLCASPHLIVLLPRSTTIADPMPHTDGERRGSRVSKTRHLDLQCDELLTLITSS